MTPHQPPPAAEDPHGPGDGERNRPDRTWLRTAVRAGLLAVFGYLLWGLVTAIDWRAVADGIAGLSAIAWVGLLVVSVLRIVAEAWLLRTVTPGLGLGHAVLAFLAPSAAASVIPGPADLVARFGMYSSWGFSAKDTTISVMASWVFTTGAKVALPLFGALGLATIGRADADVTTIATVAGAILIGGIIVLVVVLRSEQLARRVGERAGRLARQLARPFQITLAEDLADGLADRLAEFRETGGALIRQRWPAASVAALTAQFLQYGILLVSLRGVGIGPDQLHPVEVFAAFALVQLITAVPVTPGGVGIAEAAYVTLLVAESNRTLASAVTAGTLIYRVFSWIMIIPLGGLAWWWWKMTVRTEPAA